MRLCRNNCTKIRNWLERRSVPNLKSGENREIGVENRKTKGENRSLDWEHSPESRGLERRKRKNWSEREMGVCGVLEE